MRCSVAPRHAVAAQKLRPGKKEKQREPRDPNFAAHFAEAPPRERRIIRLGTSSSTFADELEGVQKRKWNSERLTLFPIIILQRCVGINALSERRGVIIRRLKAWKKGEFGPLIAEATQQMQLCIGATGSCHGDFGSRACKSIQVDWLIWDFDMYMYTLGDCAVLHRF